MSNTSAFALFILFLASQVSAQSVRIPWSNYGHDPQHTAISSVASQPLGHILWQTPVDLNPQFDGNDLHIHYGSPIVTRANTIIIPIKTGTTDGFRVDARNAGTGAFKWTQSTDYALPPHNWVPSFGVALTPKNRLYLPGAGGTVYYRDNPDATSGSGTGQIAFYGLSEYNAHPATYQSNVRINTPITVDRYGNIFFGFYVTGPTSANLQSGIARISQDGIGIWKAASTVAGDNAMLKVVHNCAPALSNDHKILYLAVSNANPAANASPGAGYLVAIDSRTLVPISKVRLKDVATPGNDANLSDEGSASPTIGSDGDVYFGVLENPYYSNHQRGWLLHFDSTLAQRKDAGAFGWDDTASVVPASMVPSYQGNSPYLVMTKDNNYVEAGGDGVNKLAILDPRDHMTDPISGARVMKEILTVAGPTPDAAFLSNHPNAVREWCINMAAVDPATKSVLVNNEDGKMYRWNLTTNSLTEALTLTSGVGEAYTPTVVGMDGTVFAINNATLFALGQ
ncbi:MAG: hypothetical protein QOG67_1870 [Verrucomicrobiota bacterium]|jgi:hypothetical protein